jgi:hypothetical protein
MPSFAVASTSSAPSPSFIFLLGLPPPPTPPAGLESQRSRVNGQALFPRRSEWALSPSPASCGHSPRAQAGDNGRELLSTPARLPHRLQGGTRLQGVSLAGLGPTSGDGPPRLSGHPGRLWRRLPPAGRRSQAARWRSRSNLPHEREQHRGTELDSRSDRSGAKAGIEPAMDADLIT